MFKRFDIYKIAAQKMLDDNYLIMDTETTGLGNDDEIVEVGIIDCKGNVLYDGLFCPQKEMHWAATQASGITKEMLEDKPLFKNEFGKLMSIMNGRPVIAFNESFDERMFHQTAQRYGLPKDMVDKAFSHSFCLQHLYNQYLNYDGHAKLETACANEGIDMVQNHRAVGDCQMTRALLEKVADPELSPNIFRYMSIKAGVLAVQPKKSEEKSPGQEPTEDKPKQNNSRNALPSYLELFNENKSIAQIADIRGVRVSTVEYNLVELYLKGDIKSIDFMIDEKYVPAILKASQDPKWDGKLKPIKEQLPEKCSYACIRATLARAKKEQSEELSDAQDKKPLSDVINTAEGKSTKQGSGKGNSSRKRWYGNKGKSER